MLPPPGSVIPGRDLEDSVAIRISAYREEDEPSRLERLAKMLWLLADHAPDVFRRVKSLYDRKGQLTVSISGDRPNDPFLLEQDTAAIERAWGLCNEALWVIKYDNGVVVCEFA